MWGGVPNAGAKAGDLRGPRHPYFPCRADPAASDPTSRDVQLLRTTKQNKGARRGRSHYAFQSPRTPEPAPSRGSSPGPPAGGGPRPDWAAPWSLVSPRLPVTGGRGSSQGEAKAMGKPDGPKPPPPTHPPIHPIPPHPSPSEPTAWTPSAGTWPGSPRGEDCLCLKVTTRSAVPGLGLVPSIPRPTELELRGHPKSQEVTGVEAPPFPPFDPQEQAPYRTSQLRGRGSSPLPAGSRGTKSTPHCLGAMERGDPVACYPVPPCLQACRGPPILPGTPKKHLGRGRTGRATGGGGDGFSCSFMALAFPQKRRGARGGKGVLKTGGGVPAPPPVGRSRPPLFSVTLYPGKDPVGNRGARLEIRAQ